MDKRGMSSFTDYRDPSKLASDSSDDEGHSDGNDNAPAFFDDMEAVEVASGANGTCGDQEDIPVPVIATVQGDVPDSQETFAKRLRNNLVRLSFQAGEALRILFPPTLHNRESTMKLFHSAAEDLFRTSSDLNPVKIRDAALSFKKHLEELFRDCSRLDEPVRQLRMDMLSTINHIMEDCHQPIREILESLLRGMVTFDPDLSSRGWHGARVQIDINTRSACVIACIGLAESYQRRIPLRLYADVAPLVASLLEKKLDEVVQQYFNLQGVGEDAFKELIQRGLLRKHNWYLIKGEADFGLSLKKAFETIIGDNLGAIFLLALEKQGVNGHCVVCLPIGNVLHVAGDVAEFEDVSRMHVYLFLSSVRGILNNRTVPSQLSLTFN